MLFLNTLAYQAESLRYSNEYDYALVDSTVFNKMWIFSPNQNSGELRLVKKQRNFISNIKLSEKLVEMVNTKRF